MAQTIVTLDQALDKIGISAYMLAKESKIRSNTIYEIKNNQKKMLDIDTITIIISTLNRLSKEKGYNMRFDINDILKYIED